MPCANILAWNPAPIGQIRPLFASRVEERSASGLGLPAVMVRSFMRQGQVGLSRLALSDSGGALLLVADRVRTRIHKTWPSLAVVSLCLLVLAGPPAAGAPYDSYLYNFWGERISAVQAYLPSRVIDGQSLGAGGLNRPRDFAVAPDGRVYILDSGNNRLVVLSPDLSLEKLIVTFLNNGVEDTFANPSGIAISSEGHLYIADTENGRIVILDSDGQLVRVFGAPRSSDPRTTLTEDFVYRPRKVEVDGAGRVYVIAANVYEGILRLDPYGEFRGFIGAPKVDPSVADIFWSRIASQEQREQMALWLPIEYANFGLSSRGLLYAVARGTHANAGDEMIKLLNPSGADVMRRVSRLPAIGDIVLDGTEFTSLSSFVDICGRQNGMFSVLDATLGRVFTYDHNGDLLYVFGGLGDTVGRFRNPVAIDRIEDTLLVLDNRGLTVFEPTRYARDIHNALALYHLGRYDESVATWQRVLDQNPNYELAYSAIAANALRQRNYELAMEYFHLGQHRAGYSDAFARYRYEWVNKHFGLIMTAMLLLIPVYFAVRKLELGRRLWRLTGLERRIELLRSISVQTVSESNGLPLSVKIQLAVLGLIDGLRYSLHVIFHPFDGFWDLKHENRGTLAAANVLVLLVILTFVFTRQYTAFTFNSLNVSAINLFEDASSLLVPFLLWVGINWAFTTLMEGKGTLRDIYTMSTYAFVPFILLNVPATLLSHVLAAPEAGILAIIRVMAVVWSVTLLILGTMVIHDYTGLKTVVTTVLVVCGIAASLFVGLLFASMIDHIIRFVFTICAEIDYRI